MTTEFAFYLLGRRLRILGACLGRLLLPVLDGLELLLCVAVRWARRRAYRAGIRPRPGSILYSPSAALIYAFRDHPPAEAFRAGLERKIIDIPSREELIADLTRAKSDGQR